MSNTPNEKITTIKEYQEGENIITEHYLNGKLHNDNGPAYINSNGTSMYYKNGKAHREDGASFEYANGDKYWHKNDQLHREDGPAIVYANGHVRYFLNDVEYSKEEYECETLENKLPKNQISKALKEYTANLKKQFKEGDFKPSTKKYTVFINHHTYSAIKEEWWLDDQLMKTIGQDGGGKEYIDGTWVDIKSSNNTEELSKEEIYKLKEELQDWQWGCEAAFGIITANPRKTLLEISKQLKDTKNQYETAIEELKMIKETIDCSLECLAYKEK